MQKRDPTGVRTGIISTSAWISQEISIADSILVTRPYGPEMHRILLALNQRVIQSMVQSVHTSPHKESVGSTVGPDYPVMQVTLRCDAKIQQESVLR